MQVERPAQHLWIVRVPVFTDIESQPFVQAFQSAVESRWHVQDGADEFRAVLDIRQVAPRQLYACPKPERPDCVAPTHGDHIDLAKHMQRFSAGDAVLTTGATLTHVEGRGIVLGPGHR